MARKAYVKPAIEAFTVQELNSIAPLMMSGGISNCSDGDNGGGGGGSGSSTIDNVVTVYIVNSPDFGIGDTPLGHSGILFELSNGFCELYSFHPIDNKSPIAAGSIAAIVNWSNAYSFDAFKKACFTVDPKDSTKKGVLVQNYDVAYRWYEPFRRAMKLTTSTSYMNNMRAKAQEHRRKPRDYNAIAYNCQSFVNEILATGNIHLRYYSEARGEVVSLANCIIPNLVFEEANQWLSSGISTLSRISF